MTCWYSVQGASDVDRPWLLAVLQGSFNDLCQRLRGSAWTSQVLTRRYVLFVPECTRSLHSLPSSHAQIHSEFVGNYILTAASHTTSDPAGGQPH